MQSFNDILFWHENIFKVDHLKQGYLSKLTDDARKKKKKKKEHLPSITQQKQSHLKI